MFLFPGKTWEIWNSQRFSLYLEKSEGISRDVIFNFLFDSFALIFINVGIPPINQLVNYLKCICIFVCIQCFNNFLIYSIYFFIAIFSDEKMKILCNVYLTKAILFFECICKS